jgi:hypothetical protein
MKHFFWLCLLLSGQLAAQPFFYPHENDRHPWTQLDFPDRDSAFQFAIISDLTGGYREGVFPMAVDKLNLLQPEFVMSIGDLIEGMTYDSSQVEGWWEEFNGWVGELEMPFFYVAGNHDLSNALLMQAWKRRYGRTFYHFTYKNALFLVLNTEESLRPDRQPYIDSPQYAYAREALAAHPEARWTFIFMHQPVWDEADPGYWPQIEALLAERPYTVFAGHTHRYLKSRRQGRNYYVLASTGGGSSLHGPAFGQFDHLSWVTLRPDGPRVSNLALSGIIDDAPLTDSVAPFTVNFLRSARLSHEPLFLPESNHGQLETTLELTNHTQQPLHFVGRFFFHPDLQPSRAGFDLELPPGTHRWPLTLNWGDSLAEPLVLAWSLSGQRADGESLTRQGEHEMWIEPVRPVSRLRQRPVIDGELGEWDEWPWQSEQPGLLGYYAHTWQGPADASFRAVVAQDDSAFYFAAQVTDSARVINPFRQVWEQDGCEWQLQPFPKGKSLRLQLSPAASAGANLIDFSDLPAGTEAACVEAPGGYTVEIRLPKSAWAAPFSRFQTQFILYDHDGAEDQYKGTKYYWFRPGPGAGVFSTSD